MCDFARCVISIDCSSQDSDRVVGNLHLGCLPHAVEVPFQLEMRHKRRSPSFLHPASDLRHLLLMPTYRYSSTGLGHIASTPVGRRYRCPNTARGLFSGTFGGSQVSIAPSMQLASLFWQGPSRPWRRFALHPHRSPRFPDFSESTDSVSTLT